MAHSDESQYSVGKHKLECTSPQPLRGFDDESSDEGIEKGEPLYTPDGNVE